jgi:hypothetical protein
MSMIKTLFKIFPFLIAVSLFSTAEAKIFKNAYISFEMPDSWDCKAQTPQWTCRSTDPTEAREAAIILVAKEVGPTDTFPLYEAHMNTPQTVSYKNGTTLNSRVVYKAQQNRYNNQTWLDGLHQDGEVKHYFTRYLATIKGPIAVLVTFSAHNRFYSKYSPSFINTINSLKIIEPKNFLQKADGRPGANEFVGNPNVGNGMDIIGDDSGILAGSENGNEKLLGIGILILAIVGYIAYRYFAKRNEE